jgi:hypothetical protein
MNTWNELSPRLGIIQIIDDEMHWEIAKEKAVETGFAENSFCCVSCKT